MRVSRLIEVAILVSRILCLHVHAQTVTLSLETFDWCHWVSGLEQSGWASYE